MTNMVIAKIVGLVLIIWICVRCHEIYNNEYAGWL